MADNWTLEQELIKLSAQSDLRKSLVSLALLDENQGDASVILENGWHRSGSETYSLQFSVISGNTTLCTLWMKACTPSSRGMTISQVMSKWVHRMTELETWSSAFVPKIYLAKDGIFLQEYIPNTLLDVVDVATVDILSKRCLSLLRCLSANGFRPSGIWHDLRSRGDDVVLVDFGVDLGDSSSEQGDEEAMLVSFLHFLSSKKSAKAVLLAKAIDKQTKGLK